MAIMVNLALVILMYCVGIQVATNVMVGKSMGQRDHEKAR